MIARAQDGTLLAARLLLAAALLPTGIARALNVSGFALTLAGSGMPFPNGVATAAVVVQVFGPLALILGVLPRLTGLALAVFATRDGLRAPPVLALCRPGGGRRAHAACWPISAWRAAS